MIGLVVSAGEKNHKQLSRIGDTYLAKISHNSTSSILCRFSPMALCLGISTPQTEPWRFFWASFPVSQSQAKKRGCLFSAEVIFVTIGKNPWSIEILMWPVGNCKRLFRPKRLSRKMMKSLIPVAIAKEPIQYDWSCSCISTWTVIRIETFPTSTALEF
jgi:hypothetical protein